MPEPDTQSNKRLPRLLRDAGAASLGTTLAVGMATFTLLGYWIGGRLGHERAGILIGVALGLVFCAYEVWKAVRSSAAGEGD